MLKHALIAAISFSALISAAQAETVQADVWADNWFALYVDGELIAEDSVSITTERSFNKESFSFETEGPFVLGFIAKDFKENDTGLEYIGTNRQQMGDGGLIAQFLSPTGEIAAVTNNEWKCLVIHTAPLDKACESASNPVAGEGSCGFSEMGEPDGWQDLGFDDSGWSAATVHSVAAVSPKMGYDEVNWNADAQIIWGPDLETDNTVLCRLEVE